jgi:hypothetical protein
MAAPKLWRRLRDPGFRGLGYDSQAIEADAFTGFYVARTTPAVKIDTDHPAVPIPWPPTWRIEIGFPTLRWF